MDWLPCDIRNTCIVPLLQRTRTNRQALIRHSYHIRDIASVPGKDKWTGHHPTYMINTLVISFWCLMRTNRLALIRTSQHIPPEPLTQSILIGPLSSEGHE